MAAAAAEKVRPLRRVEYDKLVALGVFEGERIELIDGALLQMSPIGPPHCATVDRLTELLVLALVGRGRVRIQGSFAAKHATGRRNEPAYLPHVAASVARYAGRAEADVRRSTTQVAFDLFGLGARFGDLPAANA